MKFISKNAGLRIMLKHGIPAEPITGRNAISSVSVKFENGMLNVNDEKTIEMMKAHPAFNSDFILSDEKGDPYKNTRKQNEPDHDIQVLEHGLVKKNLNPVKPIDNMSVEQKEFFEEMVKETAKKIAIPLAKDLAKKVIMDMEAEKKSSDDDDSSPEEESSDDGETASNPEGGQAQELEDKIAKNGGTSGEEVSCETCGYVAKNLRALAAHRRFDKDCIAIRS